MEALRRFPTPAGGPPSIFLLPEGGMSEIYKIITKHQLRRCLELGSGFGATSCVMAAATGAVGGKVTTIDLHRPPVNAEMLKAYVDLVDELECVVEPLGYNWWLADRIREQSQGNRACTPIYDLVFVDGAHEWEPDALASLLAVKLLKPGGWLVLDDLNFNLRMIPNWNETHGHLSDRELDAFQIDMVWSLVIGQHPDLFDFQISQHGRIGWARKRLSTAEAVPRGRFHHLRRLVGAH